MQVQKLEDKFRQSNYLSGDEVMQLSRLLNLSETRVSREPGVHEARVDWRYEWRGREKAMCVRAIDADWETCIQRRIRGALNVRSGKMRSGDGIERPFIGSQEQGSIIGSGTRNHITVHGVQSIVHRVPNMITADN